MSIVITSINGITPYKPSIERQHAQGIAQYQQKNETLPRPPTLRARNIMSVAVVTVTPGTTTRDAWALMQEHQFRHLPVLDEESTLLIAMVSDRDITAQTMPPRATSTVADIMKSPIITALPESTVKELASVMVHERISAIPIIDHSRTLCGIVTSSDILRAVMNQTLAVLG